jgi:molybdopterin converting factor small subunit
MKVKVKLFATLKQYGSEEQEIELPEGTTVADVINLFKIPKEIPLLRIVNSVHVRPDYTLKDGDVLALFPPIAGGNK